MDIFIARVKFPNDPTGTIVPHQLFVGNYIANSSIEFYSISSIFGKENRVYSPDGSSNPEIVLIIMMIKLTMDLEYHHLLIVASRILLHWMRLPNYTHLRIEILVRAYAL